MMYVMINEQAWEIYSLDGLHAAKQELAFLGVDKSPVYLSPGDEFHPDSYKTSCVLFAATQEDAA